MSPPSANQFPRRELLSGFAVMFGISIVLVFLSNVHYLLFHMLAEFFAVGVAIVMFVVAWHTYRFSHNHFLMYLGCGYFWIAWMDVAHTFLYMGMPTALDKGNFTSQFWIVTRFLEACLLISSSYFMTHTLNRKVILALFGVITAVAASAIMLGLIPATFQDGMGLTPFKINAEYVIVSLLIIAIINLHLHRRFIEPRIHQLMLVSIGLTIGAELAFTFYVSMYAISNLIGHIFKLFSFWLIYFAIIRTTLAEPFAVMARESSTYNAVPNSTVLLDSKGIIRQVNHATVKETAQSAEQIVGQHCHNWLHPKQLDHDECPLCQAIESGTEVLPLELAMGHKHRWRQFTLTPVLSEEVGRGLVQVSIDITQRKQAEADLYRSNAELSQYVEVVAHQLQEPLRSISGYVQLLAKRYRDQLDDDAKEFISYTTSATERLKALLESLLRYAQVGHQRSETILVDSNAIIASVLKDRAARIAALNASVECADLPQISARPGELYQVFWHLVDNALNYAGDKAPMITISSETLNNGGWQFCVADQGTGIAEQHQQKIFGLFSRLEVSENASTTGIGLALCKKIVEYYGGKIWLESKLGEGARFYFTWF